jgi:hypothetical protein
VRSLGTDRRYRPDSAGGSGDRHRHRRLRTHSTTGGAVPFRERQRLDAGYAEGEDGDFEYTELGEEGHGSTDSEHKIRSFGFIADFLERRVPVTDSRPSE